MRVLRPTTATRSLSATAVRAPRRLARGPQPCVAASGTLQFLDAKEVKDGVLFSFGDASDAASRRSSGVATLERPASGASSAAVPQNGASAGWAAVQSKAAYTEPGRVEAHPLVAIIALSELLIDSVSPSTRQTRKIKRSAMPPTPRGGSSSVTEKASLPGVALAFVATSVASAVGFIADVGMKRK